MRASSSAAAFFFFEQYETALEAAPLATKCVTSWVGFTVADAVAQGLALNVPPFKKAAADGGGDEIADHLVSDSEGGNRRASDESHLRYDIRRTLRMGLFGLALYGPTSGLWYDALDRCVMPDAPASAAAVAAKTTLDQIIWAPVLVTSLFAWDLSCSGEGLGQGGSNLRSKMRRDLLPTLGVNWSFWPLFHLVNFRLVPPSDRVLYVNVVQVAYNVFLCWKAAARREEEDE